MVDWPSVALLWSLPCLIYWMILAVFTAVNMAVFRRLPRASGDRRWPRMSIVIPARDEELSIGATVDAALGQAYPDFEVIAVDDGSTDRTGAILAARIGDPRLKVISGAPLPEGWLGKPHALFQGSSAASGEWLLFMDADVRLAPGALRDAVAFCEERGLGHLALFPRFERVGFWEEVLLPLLGLTLFSFFPSFVALSGRLRRAAFGSGAFNLVRADAYRAMGGHRTLARSVIDDIRLAVEVKSAGFRSTLALGDETAVIRMYRGRREIIEGFTKNLHALLTRMPVISAFNLTLGTALNVAPFAWPVWALLDPAGAFGPAGLALSGSLALLLACRGAVQVRLDYPLWPTLFHALTVLTGAWISLRSLRMAHGRKVVRWRGREYGKGETEF